MGDKRTEYEATLWGKNRSFADVKALRDFLSEMLEKARASDEISPVINQPFNAVHLDFASREFIPELELKVQICDDWLMQHSLVFFSDYINDQGDRMKPE